MRNGLNFNHLECFLSVAKTLNFSASAKELKIAQPAVSKQIKSLEEFFQQQLFNRSKHQVTLTPFGKKLLTELSPLYNELCIRVEKTLDEASSLKGEVNIGCLQEIGEKVISPLLSKVKGKYPDLSFNLHLLKGDQINSLLKEGQLSFGIVAKEIIQENMRCYKVLDEEIVLVTAKTTRTTKDEDYKDLPFVAYRRDDPLLMNFLKIHNPKGQFSRINLEFIVNSHKAMVDILQDHPFYAVLPKLSVERELKERRLKVIKSEPLKSSLYLIHLEQEYLDPKVDVVIKEIRKLLK
jgi:DNA-binding transcriptional LysR family regulator